MANENVIQDPVKQGTPTPAAQDYTPDAFTVSKELYQKNKDTFFADERLYRLDNNGQRDALGKFYDEISTPYYKNAGLADENSLKELRDKFITDNLGKLDLAKKKEEEATAPKDFPEFLDKSKIYGQFYSKQDAIKPIMGDVDLNKATQGFEATSKMQDQLIAEGKTADTIIPKMLENPDFGYIKSRPEVFMELEETEQKRINKFLKDQGLSGEEREKTFGMLKYTAEREFIDREKKKYKPDQLSLESLKAAEPFLKDAVPGTFIDPTTGMRKNKPDTEADADQLALIKKYQKEIVNGILASSASSPLSSKKTVLDDKLTKQAEQYQLVEEKRIEAQQALQTKSEDWMDKSEEWKMAQFEFIKNQKDLEQEIKDFNDKIGQDPGTAGAISRDPSDKERLQQIVNDSYILKNYWDKRYGSFRDNWDAYNRNDGSYMGVSAPKRETLYNLQNKKAEATAYFEAASRMAYNNEGPEDIKKDAKYMSQIFGDSFLKSFLGEKLTLEEPQTEQEILRKMGDIGMREGITWTNDETVHLQSKFAEHAMSLSGSLAADLPMLMMVGGITNSFKATSPAIKALTKGYKVIRNPVLEKEGATIAKEAIMESGQKGFGFYKGANKSAKRLIAFDEAVPTGWEVLKEVKPTTVGKLKGLLIGSALDEAAFVGLMGMGPGMMTGMNASHLFLPNVKLKGKVGNLLQPFLDVAYKSGLGATVGMEAGAVSSSMVKAMFTDATVKEEMNNLYPNLDETTKRVLAEVAVNSIFFGAMGAVTTGAQKSMNAPLGAKYGKYGGNNWTAYFNPVFRGKVFEAAKSADSKGYTDTAKELYGWLDMTKEPITGTELKEQRMAETEAFAQAVPIGMVRTAIEANRQAIRKLEELNNDPKFDGYVTLQTKSVKDVKPMDVVEMEGRYYEVREIAQDGKGKPVEFSMVDVETGEVTKALPEDVKADLHYKVGSRLELAVRLENHYEKLQTLNEVVADRGEYGKDFQKLPAGPPPAKGLGKGTGAFYVKPPEPSKIEKKLKDIEARETEMGDRGKAPIELPETLKKITPFGEADKFAEMPADTFSSNLSTRQKDIDTKIAGYDTQIADLEAKLNDPKFQKRMDLETKREKTAITDDIARLDHAKNKAMLSHSKELSDFFTDAKPELANLIRSKGTFEDEEIDDIIDQAWGQMTNPSKENKGKTIGQIIEDTVAEYTGEKDEVFKLQGKTFKTKDDLFAWMDNNAINPDGSRNRDWFNPDVLPESNVINAINEWEFRFKTREKIKKGLEDINKPEKIAKDLDLTYQGQWKDEEGVATHDEYKINKNQANFTVPVGSDIEVVRKAVEGKQNIKEPNLNLPNIKNSEGIDFSEDKYEPAISFYDAESRFSNGETTYKLTEMDDQLIEVTSLEELRQTPPDLIYFVKAVTEPNLSIAAQEKLKTFSLARYVPVDTTRSADMKIINELLASGLIEKTGKYNQGYQTYKLAGLPDKPAEPEKPPRETDERLIKLQGVLPGKKPNKSDLINIEGIEGPIESQPIEYRYKAKSPDDALKPITGDDPLRPILAGIFHDAENQVKAATNSFMVVVVPAEIKGESRVIDPKTGLELEGTFPRYQSVIPTSYPNKLEIGDAMEFMSELKGLMRVGDFIDGLSRVIIEHEGIRHWFDPEKLYKVFNALKETGSKNFILEYSDKEGRALVIKDAEDPRKLGLIMPVVNAEGNGLYKVIDPSNIIKSAAPVPAVKEVEKPASTGPVDITKDLKDMKDLLKFIGGPESGSGTEVADSPDVAKVKLGQIATKMIEKFTGAGITDFNTILTHIIPAVDLPTMKRLLPYLKQGYTGYSAVAPEAIYTQMETQLRNVRGFGESQLDSLIGQMNKPAAGEDYSDIIGKEFNIPSKNKRFKVLRVEKWDDPRDQKFELMEGGLFGELPSEFEPILVAVIYEHPRTGILLEKLTKAIADKKVVEVIPYENQERALELEKLAVEVEKLGEDPGIIRARIKQAPMHDLTIEQEVDQLRNMYKERITVAKVKAGEVWFEPIQYTSETYEEFFAAIDTMTTKGPLEPVIRKYVPDELLAEALNMDLELQKYMNYAGLNWDAVQNMHYLREKFYGISLKSDLIIIGEIAQRIEAGDKRTSPDKLPRQIEWFRDKSLPKAKENIENLKKFLFTWRLKYLINTDQRIADYRVLTSIASTLGITDKNVMREQMETALVELADRIARDKSMNIADRYNRILTLYNTIPTLGVKSSNSKELQQYSTPVPIGFLMNVYTNADQVNRIFEPQAGNGALLIGTNKGSVRANEIDPVRERNLISQGYRTTNFDAREPFKGKFDVQFFDAILTNPPFGGDFSMTFPGDYKLIGTHAMVANSLEMLADNGKAGIIIGGHTEFKPNGQISGRDLQFFNYLNHYFNVEDVINIPGDFYSKMGTSYPIRLILINGKKPAPSGFAPLKSERDNTVTSWSDLYDRVNSLTTNPDEKSILRSPVDADGGTGPVIRGGDSRVPKNTEGIGTPSVPGESLPDVTTGGTPKENNPPTGVIPGAVPGMGPTGTGKPDNELPPDVKPVRSPEDPIIRRPADRGSEIQSVPGTGDIQPIKAGNYPERTKRTVGLTNRDKDEVIPYRPLSRVPGGNTLTPGAMANELEEALNQLKGEVGDIDTYVMGRLKYNSIEDLSSAFYAEQVDGIGMSVFNIENGDAVIIGDQTGVGKGRIAAGIISYAVENGFIPVFITKSANLFTDIYRDLMGIGRGQYVPFIMNRAYDGQVTKVYKPNTDEVMYSASNDEIDSVLKTNRLPEKAQIVLSTYSQFNTDGRDLNKRNFLLSLGSRAIFIMDESHTASGVSNVGKFFQEFVMGAKGGVYLSATFAKRPDNLPIYAMKTVLREANMTYEELINAITAGGPALQEIISSQLSESIQFTRRQLNMENTERNWYVLGDEDPESFFYNPELGKQLKKDYDGVTKIMHDIIEFQRDHVAPVMKAKDEEVKVEGGQTELRRGTVDMGVTNTPYFSKVFNVVDQLLVAVKVKHSIPLIIEELKAGRKPVVALKSTMEAMIGDLDLEMNEELELDFRHVLMRGLNGVMRYTVTYPNGVKEKFELDVSELGDLGKAAYYDLKNKIKEISTGVTISPIDVLIKGITDAGYQVAEITGRKTRFEMTTSDYTKGKYINNTRPNKNELVNRFNNEPGWVAILNVSGSTGISMHSSPKFNDTSQRTMFILQNDLDVNVVVQIQGRVFRSDQLNKPIFNNVLSVLPAEKRLAMMNAKKLKSLYANTSSNQKSSKTITEAVDFLNKYGDEVVLQYLIENPDINNMMGKPVDLSKDSPDKDGIAHKITGKIAVLPIETQEQFYNEISERYEQLLEYMNDTGTNDLEVTSEPLNAVTLKRELAIQGKGGISVFGDDTHIEEVEVDVLKKPLLKKEIDEILAKELNGISSIDYKNNMIAQMKKSVDDVTNKRLAEIQKTYDARVSAKRKEAEGRKGTAQDIQLWLDDQLGQMEEHHDRMVSMYQDFSVSNKSSMERLMNFFYPGKVLEIPFAIADQFGTTRMSKGVFLGFDVNVNKPNPFTPSNVMMKFATSDSRRTFRIPASKDAQIDQIISNSYSLSTGDQFDVLNNWDKLKPSRNREIRYIITGNILQGMAQFDKGRLIEYSMQDGTIRKGILMPESWINEDRGKVIIPAEKVYNIIRALAPMDFVESTNGNIQIMKDRADYDSDEVYYYLKVPESRTKGEKYWGDKGLKDFVYEKVFDKRGDRFAGRFPEHRLMDLLKYLQSRYGETFEVRADRISQGESSQSSASAIIREMGYTTEKVNKGGQKHPDREVQGAKSKVNMKQRIKPEPIIGGTPKKLWQIEKHFADAINQKIFWDKTARKGMAGSYTPSIAKLVMQKMFMTNLNLAAHELGHALDDVFHLVGPEAQPMFHIYQQELRELWQFGSEPPKGIANPLQYRMMEGVAEYFRAYIVNPKETVRRYPQFSRWFADQIKSKSPDVWKAVEQFGVDVRTYYGSSAIDQIGSNVKFGLEGQDKTPWGWTSLFKPTSKQGDFAITMFDTFAIKMLNSNRALEKAYRWSVAQSGKDLGDPKDIPPSENFIILARLLMGHQDKIGNMLMKGVTNVNLERQIDPVTKQPISFPWKYEALPDASIPEMEAFRQRALKVGIAERVVEAVWKFGAKQVRMDLNAFDSMLPPMEVLAKYPHITQKWINKIKSILDKIDDGELDPDKVFLPEERYNFDSIQIIGVNQEGFTDLDVAKKALKEFEDLKTSKPDEAGQITEYNRRRRMIDMHYIRYAHESGLMSDELYELITQEDLHYISMHRYYQEAGPTESSTDVAGFDKMYSIGNDSRGYEGKLHIHPLKGSARPIVDPDLIQMEAAFSLVLNSDKNNVLRHFALALVGDRESYDGEPVHMSDIGYMVKGPGQHVLKFYVAGSAMFVKIQDPHVFKELSKLTNVQALPNWFTFMPRLLRNSITHSPAFLIKNMPRDFINSMMIAETKFKPSDFKSPFKEKDISSWDMYDLAGGGQFGFYIKNKTNYYRLQREWMFKHSKDPNRFFMDFKIFAETKWDDLTHFMSSSEKATRIAFMKAEYNKLIKEGMEPMDALLKASFEARDLLDFAVAGEWMKVINQFMPFSNAAVRGVEKVIKTARDRPGNLLFWWGMVAVLPAVANSMMIAGMDDDTIDEYKQLPPYQRDMFFNIPLGNGRWLTITKPFELGYMSSAVQRILDKYLLNDDQGLNEDWYRLGYNMLFPFDFAGVSGGFAGFIHALTNRDFFRNRWVIPPDEVDISISLRNTERATRIGQLLQEGSRAFDKKHEPIFDARKIDDFIQAQIPYYGTYLLKGSEAISGGPKQRAMRFDWSDLGIVKASPVYNAEDVQWVVKTSKKYKLGNRPEMDLLNGAIKVYFSEEIQADREKMLKVGADIRKIATIIRKQWDRPEVNFAKMYEEYKNSK
jgi:hypothetical protein